MTQASCAYMCRALRGRLTGGPCSVGWVCVMGQGEGMVEVAFDLAVYL